MHAIFWVVVGMLIGWQVPQPTWVKLLWDKAVAKIKGIFNKEA